MKESLKLSRCLASSSIHAIVDLLDLLLNVVHLKKKIIKERVSHKVCMHTLI